MEALQQGNIRLAASLLLVREGAHASGAWQMILPTLITLDSIGSYTDVAAMLAAMLAAVADESHLQPLTAALQRQGMHSLR